MCCPSRAQRAMRSSKKTVISTLFPSLGRPGAAALSPLRRVAFFRVPFCEIFCSSLCHPWTELTFCPAVDGTMRPPQSAGKTSKRMERSRVDLLMLFQNVLSVTWQQIVMWCIGGLLIYLAIAKDMEPSLLLPIGFGAILGQHSGCGRRAAGRRADYAVQSGH